MRCDYYNHRTGENNIPCIEVNPFLFATDILRIKETLNIPVKSDKGKIVPLVPARLHDLLRDDAIELRGNVTHWTEAIEQAGLLLLNVGAIYPRYHRNERIDPRKWAICGQWSWARFIACTPGSGSEDNVLEFVAVGRTNKFWTR